MPRSARARRHDLRAYGEEDAAEGERLDVDAGESAGPQRALGLAVGMASLEEPAPGTEDEPLEPTHERALGRSHVLDAEQSSTWPQDPPDLGDRRFLVRHGAEH